MFCPAIPVTCCEAIAIAPSEIAVQFGPRPPSARLKLSDATVPIRAPLAAQETATLVTLAEAIVPEPSTPCRSARTGWSSPSRCRPRRRQLGGERERAVGAHAEVSPPLSCSTTVPDSPDTAAHRVRRRRRWRDTATLVTLAEAIVPEPSTPCRSARTGWSHRHAVRRAAGQRGRERERPVGGHAEVVAAVILQHHRPGQPRHRPAHRVRRHAAVGRRRPRRW